MKRTWLALIIAACLLVLNACASTQMIMQTANNRMSDVPAAPPIKVNAFNKDKIRKTLEAEVYGPVPALGTTFVKERRVINKAAINGLAILEEVTLSVTPDFGTGFIGGPQSSADFTFVLLSPNNANGPVPVIMIETFCPNHDVIPFEGVSKPVGDYYSCAGGGMMSKVFGYFFGRYITTPPLEDILARGYAVATTYSSTYVPDRASAALPLLKAQYNDARAIGMWAYQFSAMSKTLKDDSRFDKTVAFGHSRYGKSALVAAAFYDNIDGVMAHQSGTGGASLSRDKPGETAAQITDRYPHWFSASYNEDSLTLDQHHLLALVAPRPILIGNAKRDVWSDPEGAFRAAKAVTPLYQSMGKTGMSATRIKHFRPSDDIAYWIRSGTHGIVKEDWPAFLEFMDAHFGTP